MKIAITGKGGVGKTTLAALLAKAYADAGYAVLAIDADPDANLASTLRIPHPQGITPLSQMHELIEQRTGATPGTFGTLFRMNPEVADLPEKLWVEQHGIRLIVMGGVKKGGGGCVCPESALLKALTQHLILQRKDVVIMDMEAGIEHLGRATAAAVNALIAVVEPTRRSIETALRIKALAHEIGIGKMYAVGNRVRTAHEREFIATQLSDLPLLGHVDYEDKVIEADHKNLLLWEHCPNLFVEAKRLQEALCRIS